MAKPSSIVLELPFPPSVNTYYSVARGRKILSAKGRLFKAMCVLPEFARLKLKDDISVTIILSMPDKRKRDIDNYVKAVLDVLTENEVYLDDSQVKLLTVWNTGEVVKEGCACVEIETLEKRRKRYKKKTSSDNIIQFPVCRDYYDE